MKPKPYVDNFILLKCIRDDSFLTRDERFLMLLLASYRHVHTLECNPKLQWLIDRFGKTARTIQRIVKQLEEKDYLVSIRRGFTKPSNFYFASDFHHAFHAYHCPQFKGNRTTLLKANRKKWALKAQNVVSSYDTKDVVSIYKKDKRKRINIRDEFCPHCGQERRAE